MSLKTLLAVGESFSGTDMAPYEVKKSAIPVFAKGEENGQLALNASAETKKEDQSLLTSTSTETTARVKLAPERRRIEQEPQERRRLLDRVRRAPARSLTQAEMSLENVRVVRNDLSDSDLELAPRRAARQSSDLNPFAPRPIAAIGRPAHEKSGMGARVARWFRFLKKPRS